MQAGLLFSWVGAVSSAPSTWALALVGVAGGDGEQEEEWVGEGEERVEGDEEGEERVEGDEEGEEGEEEEEEEWCGGCERVGRGQSENEGESSVSKGEK